MAEHEWQVVDEVAGELQAEILRGLLEAHGIQVWLSKEGAGRAYALGVGTLGRVEILVPSDSSQRARAVLDDYYAGNLEVDEVSGDGFIEVDDSIYDDETSSEDGFEED